MQGIEHRPLDFRTLGIPALALLLLTLAVFGPAAGYDFVHFDDPLVVSNNERVLTGLTPGNLWWACTSVHEQWWLPVLWISYMLDAEFQGPGPAGFHRTNVLLHAANAALLFWVLAGMTGFRGRSWFVAALFALHPLRVESVAWIAERKDVLSGLFFMLALLAYHRHARRGVPGGLAPVFVLMLLGSMAKTNLVALPLLLLLLDHWPLGRGGRGRLLLAEKIPLFVLAGVFAFLTLATHPNAGAGAEAASWLDRLALIAPNYGSYLAKTVWPTALSLVYVPSVPPLSVRLLAPPVLAAITFAAWRCRASRPYLLVGWLWFLVALFPVIRGIRFDEESAFSDRYTYLPSIGLAIALVWTAGEWARPRRNRRLAAVAAGVAAVVACTALTRNRLPVWTNSETLFRHLLDFSPDHDMATLGYGRILLDQGKPAEALPYLAKALDRNPDLAVVAAAHAEALIALDRNDEAIAELRQALVRCGEADPGLNMLLARAYLNTRRAAEALPHLERAVAGHPENPGWQVERIRALFEADRPDDARMELRRLRERGLARFTDFDSLISHFGGLWLAGERLHAWHFFQNNLERLPDNVALHHSAAWLLATDPRPPAPTAEAVRLAQRAVELNARPDCHLLATLAAALAANGEYAEARLQAEQALILAQQVRDSVAAAEISRQLAAYREQRPWREVFANPPDGQP